MALGVRAKVVRFAPVVYGGGERHGFAPIYIQLARQICDSAYATGKFPIRTFPVTPVRDGAGEIAAVGVGVTGWRTNPAAAQVSTSGHVP